MKKLTIHSRYKRPDNYPGLITSGKSMTVPGQAVTPQEIIRAMTSGVLPQQIFHDEDLSSFDRLHITDKIDYLNDLAERNTAMSDSIKFRVHELQKQAKLQELQAERDRIKKEVQAELNNTINASNAKNVN